MDMLGKKVKDTVTGITGTAVTKIIYMNGCVQYAIQPKKVVNGVPAEAKWYDEDQVVLMPTKKTIKPKRKPTGGPSPKHPHKKGM